MAITDFETDPESQATRPRRRRRKPAEARAEILQAARELLAELPAHEVTVIAIMARTTLSRKSFYVYFQDRADLLAALVGPMRRDADATLERWRESTEIAVAGRAALRSAAELYRTHGPVLRALAEASDRDRDAARVWKGVTNPVIEVAALKIAQATAAGHSHGLEPEPIARALVTMNIHYLLDELADNPDGDIDATVATLVTIWERTLYASKLSEA